MKIPTEKQARKTLAAPAPARWTPAKAQAVRLAKMVIATAEGHPDAWLYAGILNPPTRMAPGELERKRFDEVNAALMTPERIALENEERAETEARQLAVITRMAAAEADKVAEMEVLRICRSKVLPGIPCMRITGDEACTVVDNYRYDSPVLFAGSSWTAVLAAMHAKGIK